MDKKTFCSLPASLSARSWICIIRRFSLPELQPDDKPRYKDEKDYQSGQRHYQNVESAYQGLPDPAGMYLQRHIPKRHCAFLPYLPGHRCELSVAAHGKSPPVVIKIEFLATEVARKT